ARIEALDQADGVDQARLLHEQPLEHVDARVEVLVDRVHHVVHGRALLDDLGHAPDHLVEPVGDLAQGDDGRDQVVDQRQDDQEHGQDQHPAGGGDGVDDHATTSASSTITSSDPPYSATPA